MSVDKFGRHSSRRLRAALKGPKGDGFELTAEGDFDIKTKRLRHVKEPKDGSDAVNLEYLRENCVQYGLSNELKPFIDARQNYIRNVKEPAEKDDVATRAYVDSKTPKGNRYLWDFLNRRITNCSNPIEDSDAVNLRYFQYWTPKVNTNENAWSFVSYRLAQVGSPTEPSDAVTLKYLKDNAIVKKNLISGYDAENCTISRVALAKEIDDAVSKRYLKDALIKLAVSVYKTILVDNQPTQEQVDIFEGALLNSVSEWFD